MKPTHQSMKKDFATDRPYFQQGLRYFMAKYPSYTQEKDWPVNKSGQRAEEYLAETHRIINSNIGQRNNSVESKINGWRAKAPLFFLKHSGIPAAKLDPAAVASSYLLSALESGEHTSTRSNHNH